MQNYNRIYDYIYEYWKLIYDVYAKHAVAFQSTYYNLDKESLVWDNENLMGGYYEKIGSLSGLKWNKYSLLPIYFVEETNTIFDGQDVGIVNEGESECVIPAAYGIEPNANDMIKFDQTFLVSDPSKNVYPIFCVTGIQKHAHQDKPYWKLKLSVEQSRTTDELDAQVSNNFIFFEYDKKVHTIPEAQTMTRMLSKAESLSSSLKSVYDENSGLYFI